MKSYTDIEQSKKLAEILPFKSVDMWYWEWPTAPKYNNYEHPMFHKGDDIVNVPCWSLAALINVLPIVYINNKKELCGPLHIDITDSETPFILWYVNPFHKGNIVELQTKEYDNLVDACYEMILKLHKDKLL